MINGRFNARIGIHRCYTVEKSKKSIYFQSRKEIWERFRLQQELKGK